MSRIVFPLSTSLEVATGQETLSAVERAKQAAILFDEIIFEEGLLVVEVGSTSWPIGRRAPASALSAEYLGATRTVQEGVKGGLMVRASEGHLEMGFGLNLPRYEDAF